MKGGELMKGLPEPRNDAREDPSNNGAHVDFFFFSKYSVLKSNDCMIV